MREENERCLVEQNCAGDCSTCETSIVNKGIGRSGVPYRIKGDNYISLGN